MSRFLSHSLSRRQLLAVLGSLLVSWAFAEDDKNKDKGDDKGGDKKDDRSGKGSGSDRPPPPKQGDGSKDGGSKPDTKPPTSNTNKGSPPPNDTGSRSRTVYDSVSVARGGTVMLTGGKLQTTSPWINYLAPGMWIRAEGTWSQDVFKASSLEIADPTYFSYYRGPASPLGLGNGWVEVWFSADGPNSSSKRLALQASSPSNEVTLLVRNEGGKTIAAPPGLPQLLNAPQGWVLAKGEVQGDSIKWKSIEPFNR